MRDTSSNEPSRERAHQSKDDSPERLRAFVAVFPSSELIERLARVQRELAADLSQNAIRWTQPGQIHLTLQFLGSISAARVSELEAALEKPAAECRPFCLEMKGLGCFPSVRVPKIVWTGLCGEMKPLEHLQRLVNEAMGTLGIEREERSFRPHLTLGRVKRLNFREVEHVRTLLHARDSELFGEWLVKEVHLMRSNLSPAGATYRSLACFELGKGRKAG
jgi:RNA 2',3'-cyclic 3'-phosphodiesterase